MPIFSRTYAVYHAELPDAAAAAPKAHPTPNEATGDTASRDASPARATTTRHRCASGDLAYVPHPPVGGRNGGTTLTSAVAESGLKPARFVGGAGIRLHHAGTREGSHDGAAEVSEGAAALPAIDAARGVHLRAAAAATAVGCTTATATRRASTAVVALPPTARIAPYGHHRKEEAVLAEVLAKAWAGVLTSFPQFDNPIRPRTALSTRASLMHDPHVKFDELIAFLFPRSASFEPLAFLGTVPLLRRLAGLASGKPAKPSDRRVGALSERPLPFSGELVRPAATTGVADDPMMAVTVSAANGALLFERRFAVRWLLALVTLGHKMHGDYNFTHAFMLSLLPREWRHDVPTPHTWPIEKRSLAVLERRIVHALDFNCYCYQEELWGALSEVLNQGELAWAFSWMKHRALSIDNGVSRPSQLKAP